MTCEFAHNRDAITLTKPDDRQPQEYACITICRITRRKHNTDSFSDGKSPSTTKHV